MRWISPYKMINIVCILVIIFSLMGIGIYLINEKKQEVSKDNVKLISRKAINYTDKEKSGVDFNSLWTVNPDIIAWIRIKGTDIDYPILWSGIDKEEDYYLNHTVFLEEKPQGALFIQRVNAGDFSNELTVIYGHNLRSGAMFGGLSKYLDYNYMLENRYIELSLPDKKRRYEIFAVERRDNYNILPGFERNGFLQQLNIHAACYNEHASLDEGRLIALSTCDLDNDKRLLVFAVECVE